MSQPRIALVVNPAAGSGAASAARHAVERRLRAGAVVTTLQGRSPAETRQLVRAALPDHDALLTLGGDGAAHLAIQEMAGGDIPFGVIPAGTGNDIAAVLGIPSDPLPAADALLAAIRSGAVRRVDLGRTEAAEPRWWFTVLCAGFDSAVNERANRMRWPRGSRRYDLSIVLESVRLSPRRYHLVIDGVAEDLDATMVSVGNAAQYGGGKLIAPGARIDDGQFRVCIVGPVSRRTLLGLAPKLDVGGHVGHPAVRMVDAQRVRIEADRIAYADGERIGPLPVTTRCVPAALAVLVPPAAT